MMPLVSVAIRAFRREWLHEAIASVLAQTHRNLELVIYDDAGDLEAVAAPFTDPRLRYVRATTRLDASGRFRAAVALCRGEFIALLDDDDRYEPMYVERLLSALVAEPQAGIAFCRTTFDTDGTLTTPVDRRPAGVMREAARRMLADRWTVSTSHMLMRRTALEQAWRDQAMPDGVAPDTFVNLRVALAGWWHVLVDAPLVVCRWHARQISRTPAALDFPIATLTTLRVDDLALEGLRRSALARAHLVRGVDRVVSGQRESAREDCRAAGAASPGDWRWPRRALALAAAAGPAGSAVVRVVLRMRPRGRHRHGPPETLGAPAR